MFCKDEGIKLFKHSSSASDLRSNGISSGWEVINFLCSLAYNLAEALRWCVDVVLTL